MQSCSFIVAYKIIKNRPVYNDNSNLPGNLQLLYLDDSDSKAQTKLTHLVLFFNGNSFKKENVLDAKQKLILLKPYPVVVCLVMQCQHH